MPWTDAMCSYGLSGRRRIRKRWASEKERTREGSHETWYFEALITASTTFTWLAYFKRSIKCNWLTKFEVVSALLWCRRRWSSCGVSILALWKWRTYRRARKGGNGHIRACSQIHPWNKKNWCCSSWTPHTQNFIPALNTFSFAHYFLVVVVENRLVRLSVCSVATCCRLLQNPPHWLVQILLYHYAHDQSRNCSGLKPLENPIHAPDAP